MKDQVTVKQVTLRELNSIDKLMVDVFPAAERSPAAELLSLSHDTCVEYSAYYNEDVFCGFSCIIGRYGLSFVYYFAIEKAWQRQGIGTHIFQQICNRVDYPMVLNIESLNVHCDNLTQRKKRLDFYARCGMNQTGYCLVHDGVKYDILASQELREPDMVNYKKLLVSISPEYENDLIVKLAL